MPDAKSGPSEREEDHEDDRDPETAGEGFDLDSLRARGDADGLLTLAKAYRSGTAPGGRDLKKCHAAYVAAAELGSGDAEYAVALFCMSGGVVAQDLKEGATRLRSAAEKGSVPAKVYLGNLYELGIHYKADPEKADVWYRNAARGAAVESAAGSPEYASELAELGCARYVLAAIETGGLEETDKTRLLQRARAHGHGLKIKGEETVDRPTLLNALEGAEAKAPSTAPAAAAGTTAEAKANVGAKEPADPKAKRPKAIASNTSAGLAAFGYALLFVATGVGAGYAATLGAKELVAHGHLLPGLGTRIDLVFPIVLGAVGVLPTCLVYRLGAVLKALVIGAAFGGIGWVAWGTGQGAVHAHRPIQALVFGIAGFVAGLLVLGLLGGVKKRHPTG